MKNFKNKHFYVVLDFEATCKDGDLMTPQEIIQFPAVLVDGFSFQVLDTFNTFVKPAYSPVLTDFCKSLTGITQEEVDKGVPFSRALAQFQEWLQSHRLYHNFTVITWGNWDLMCMLPAQCDLSKISVPWCLRTWCNLKYVINRVVGIHPKVGCKEVVTEYFKLPWIGTAHNGLHDSLNVAQLLPFFVSPGHLLPLTHLTNHGRRRWQYIQETFWSNKKAILYLFILWNSGVNVAPNLNGGLKIALVL